MECPICMFENPKGFTFCGHCGANIDKACRSNFKKSSTKSERKHVTVFFTDLSGYTEMTERLDPEDVRLILNRVFKRVTGIIEKYDGFIERYIGDSVMAVFGIPKAHEDDPVRAIYAAMEIHALVKAMNPWVQEKTGRRIFMHTGINTGLVVTGEVDRTTGAHGLTGLDVNIASRLESLSGEDEIIVGEATRELAEQHICFKAFKPVKVKGKKELFKVYKVLSKKNITPEENLARHPFFLGRNEEIERLNESFTQLIQKNRGQAIFVLGDPGIGKSRLVAESKKNLENLDLTWLKSQSSAYLNETSYGTFLDLLKNFAGIKQSDNNKDGWNKLEEKLMLLFPQDVPDTLPYLATILSMKVKGSMSEKLAFLDGETLRHQIFRAFYILLKQLTYERPVILEFEDFHWADDSSVEVLCHLLPMVEEFPLLFLFVSRKTTGTPASNLKRQLKEKHGVSSVGLLVEPLKTDDILDLAGKTMGQGTLSSHLRGLILRKCEGNPLYLEELLRSLLNDGLIARHEATGQFTVTAQAGKVAVPSSLRGLVESNIDRLDEEIKEILKIASVIGRNFLYRLLVAVEDKNIRLDKKLEVLIQEELIKERVENPDPEYFFYHDLIRDAAYDTILLDQREKLHRRVGEAIEQIFHDQLERFYGLLSYHFAKASQWNKAQRYLIKAGDQASRIAGDSEALSHYKKAMSAHDKLFGSKMDKFDQAVYLRKLGEIYFRRGENDKALASFKRAFEQLELPYPFGKWNIRFAMSGQLFRQVFHRLFSFVYRKKTGTPLNKRDHEVIRIYETMAWIDSNLDMERLAFDVISVLNHAEKRKAGHVFAHGYSGVGFLLDTLGWFSFASHYHKLAAQFMDDTDNDLISASILICSGYHHHFTGEWDRALSAYKDAAAQFKAIGHLKKYGNAELMIAIILKYKGEFSDSLALNFDIYKIGKEIGDKQLQGHASVGIGMNQIILGNLEDAKKYINESISLLKAIPDYYALCMSQTELSKYFLIQKDYTRAYHILNGTEKTITEKGLKGFVITVFYNTLLETYLLLFENKIRINGKIVLARLGKYVKLSETYGKRFKCGMPKSIRLKGLFYWLKGNPKLAFRHWQTALETAEALGCPHESGMIYLTMGKRTGDRACLEKAKKLFAKTGATRDLEIASSRLHDLRTKKEY